MRYLLIIISSIYLYSVVTGSETGNNENYYNPEIIDAVALGPPNYQLYEYMKQYAEEYDVPFDYALKCAKEETGYQGKFDFRYTPFHDNLRRSYADAYGPLQVRIPTANEMWGDLNITPDMLGYDIKLNVITSFRYKKYLFDIYHDWAKVYSVYNQGWKGKDNINDYARKITG